MSDRKSGATHWAATPLAQAFRPHLRFHGELLPAVAFITTDDDRRFQSMVRLLPDRVEAVRLFDLNFSNFRFLMGQQAMKFMPKDYQEEAVRDVLTKSQESAKTLARRKRQTNLLVGWFAHH